MDLVDIFYFAVIFSVFMFFVLHIIYLIHISIKNEETLSNYEAREIQMLNELQFATLQEIRIDADAPPLKLPDNHGGGLVYDTCSCTQESSTGEVGGVDGDSCCAVVCLDECAICLDEFIESRRRRATIAACNHRFHASCIEAWLAKDEQHTCPLCRQTVY